MTTKVVTKKVTYQLLRHWIAGAAICGFLTAYPIASLSSDPIRPSSAKTDAASNSGPTFCEVALTAIKRAPLLTGRGAWWTVKTGTKIVFYPVTAPVRLARDLVRSAVEKEFVGTWKTPWVAVLHSALLAGGIAFEVKASDAAAISMLAYQDQTDPEFMSFRPDDVVVVLDNFEKKARSNPNWNDRIDPYRSEYVKMMTEHRKKDFPNLVYIHAETYLEFIDQLRRVRMEKGKISRLDVYSHGRGCLIDTFRYYSPPGDGEIFDSGAVIRFNGCEVGQDPGWMGAFGKRFLAHGGVVLAAKTLTINTGVYEAVNYAVGTETPKFFGELNRVVAAPFSFFSAMQFQKFEWGKLEWSPVARVEIPASR